jgi:hypothetical protein
MSDRSIHRLLEKLQTGRHNREATGEKPSSPLPAFLNIEASLEDRLRTWRTACYILATALLMQTFLGYLLLRSKDNALADKAITVVSEGGAMTVKPGTVADSVVHNKFDFLKTWLMVFSYDTVESTYPMLELYMDAPLRQRFRAFWTSHLNKWKTDRYKETLKLTPTTRFFFADGEYIALEKVVVEREMMGSHLPDETRYIKLVLSTRAHIDPRTNSVLGFKDYKWLSERDFIHEEEHLSTLIAAER